VEDGGDAAPAFAAVQTTSAAAGAISGNASLQLSVPIIILRARVGGWFVVRCVRDGTETHHSGNAAVEDSTRLMARPCLLPNTAEAQPMAKDAHPKAFIGL
jgi:hypothetical protein